MTNPLILVTGGSGYIAGRLISRLLDHEFRVRVLARDPLRLRGRSWYRHVEHYSGDVTLPSTLPAALEGVHTAYYLIHNMTFGRGYTIRELEGAHAFASCAKEAGLKHIIYLGGLADPQAHIAAHLRSRIETGRVLRQSRLQVTEFRSGAIIGSGSISFEMIRFMCELFPILLGPTWLRNKSQPIAIQNVIDYLLAALEHADSRSQIFEIGGPEVTSYAELMLRYARMRGLKRQLVLLPVLPVWLMAIGVGLMTPVPRPIAYALISGLANDSVVQDNSALRVFPHINLIGIDQATRESLAQLHPTRLERVWDEGQPTTKSLKHEGFFIEHREVSVNATPGKVFHVITNMGGVNGWPYANWLWRLRGWLDKILKGSPLPIGEGWGVRQSVRLGERIDYYRVAALEADHLLRLHAELSAPGDGWMEWRLEPKEPGTRLIQTSYFAPRGLPGFLYWYLLYPFHALVFHGLIRAIARKAILPQPA